MITRQRVLFVVLVLMLGVGVFSVAAQDKPLRVTYVVNGTLGDKSFIDSAQRGLDQSVEEFGIDVRTIETGFDPANWESGLADMMADTDNYDVLIAGSFSMLNYMASRVHLYPDKVFFFYDASMPYDDPSICVDGCTNVYSITYAQNEGSFLAGVYAAAMSLQTDIEGINESPIIGALGGQDIPVINDFIVGYEQGACLVNPESQVLVQYAGSWSDPARGKEIALAMYDQGADIVFQVAGGTGEGVFEAATEQGAFALGVDSDQASIIADTDPDQAARILTSMMKNVDKSLYRAIELYLAGELPIGTADALGIADGGVGLAYNDIYTEVTPQPVQDLVAAVEAAVLSGDISIITAFGDAAVPVGQGCAAMPETEFDAASFLSS
ncbi:MAG: BMP family ABC transporter substrate-binding protein [Anaerolineae bacterium]|nr:BMP family ABC transporter substrate-binding protein [Anaerolineae bacterium]